MENVQELKEEIHRLRERIRRLEGGLCDDSSGWQPSGEKFDLSSIENFQLKDFINPRRLQDVATFFYKATGIPLAILERDGTILAGAGWQKICTRYHRVHPDCAEECRKSDRALMEKLGTAGRSAVHLCRNGIVDCLVPIRVEGEYIAGLYSGNFLNEKPDAAREEEFRARARRYGFPEGEYIAALRELPVIPQEKMTVNLEYLGGLADMIGDISAREIKSRRIRAQLQTSERKYRDLVEMTHSIILKMDPRGVITFINGYGEEFFGYASGELVGRNVIGSIVPERETTGRNLRDLADQITRHPQKYLINENENIKKDGERVWVRWTNHVVDGEGGGEKEILCHGVDISDKRHIEEALRMSEERFSKAFKASPDMVAITRMRDSVIIDVNDTAVQRSGLRKEEMLGKTPYELGFFEGALQEKVRLLFKKYGNIRDEEITIRTRDGEGWALLSCEQITIGDEECAISIIKDITERRRIEEALQASEAKFRSLAENTASAIIILQDDRLRYVNPVFLKMLGYSWEDIRDEDFWNFVHPDFRSEARSRAAVRMEGLPVIPRYEMKVLKKGGEECWVDFSASRFFYEGRPAILGSGFDITEKKRTQKMLEVSEFRHRIIAELAMDFASLFRVGDNGEVKPEWVTGAFEQITGYSIDEILHRDRWDIMVYPDDRPILAGHIAILLSGQRDDCEYRIRPREGAVRWLFNRSVPVIDPETEKVTAIYGVTVDVTEKRAREDALRESEERYRSIFEKAGDFIYIHDLEGRIIDINPSACRALGIDRQGVRGLHIENMAVADEWARVREEIEEAIERGAFGPSVYRIASAAENEITVEVQGILFYKEGKPHHIMGIARDVTRQKQYEQALREAKQRLENIVDFLPDATFVIDDQGRVIAWNRAVEEFIGVPKEEMLGKGDFEYALHFYGERKPILVDTFFDENLDVSGNYDRCWKQGMTIFAESYLPRGNRGRGAYVWGKASPLFDNQGNIVGAIETIRDVTSHKTIEKALIESEEKFRLLFEQSADAQLLIDDNVFVDFNGAALTLLGHSSKGDLVDKRPSELSPEQQPDGQMSFIKEKDVLTKAYNQGTHRFEWVHRRKEGENFPAEVTLTAISYRGRKLFHATMRDISDRKRAEEALRSSEKRFRNIVELMNEGLMAKGTDERIVYVNDKMCRLLGYRTEEILGKTVHDFMEGENREYTDQLEVQRKQGINEPYELVLRRSNGELIQFHVSPMGLFDEEGRYQGSYGVFMDITERKRYEWMLAESEKRYRDIFESAGTSMIILNEDMTISLVSHKMEEFNGYRKEEMLGKSWIEFVLLSDVELLKSYHRGRRTHPGSVPNQYEMRMPTRSGAVKDCIVNVAMIPGTRQSLVSFLDISDIKRLEREVINISMNEQQRIGRDLHDGLGQQLTGIAFLTKVLEKSLRDGESIALQDLENIVELVNESINMTKDLSRGLCPVNVKSFGFIDSIKELCRRMEILYGVRCRVRSRGDVIVQDDTMALQLYYIVREALNNALRHGRADNLEVSLHSRAGRMTLRIKDNGRGLDASEAGGGLGLSIMRYRAGMLGGHLEVKNNPGGGVVVICECSGGIKPR